MSINKITEKDIKCARNNGIQIIKIIKKDKEWRDEVEKYLKKEYITNGKGVLTIAKELGYNSKDPVKKLFKYYGISIRKVKEFPLSKEELEKMYIDENLSYNEIAKMTGTCYDTVMKYTKKYGIKKPDDLLRENVIRRSIEGSQEKFGTNSPFENKEHLEKANTKAREIYGVSSNVFESEEIINRIKKTNLERRGVDSFSKTDEFKEKVSKKNKKNFTQHYTNFGKSVFNNRELLKEYLTQNHENVVTLAMKVGCSYKTIYDVLNKWGLMYLIDTEVSRHESKIVRLINEYDDKIKVIKNTRSVISPLELDIYLPEYKVGIEVNPYFTHSCEYLYSEYAHILSKDYHENKTFKCNELGIKLIHVWEYMEMDEEDLLNLIFCKNEIELIDNKFVDKDRYSLNEVKEHFRILGEYKGIFYFDNKGSYSQKYISKDDKYEIPQGYGGVVFTSGFWEVQRL